MKFQFKNAREVSPGAYQADLVATAETEGKFGPQLRIDFEVTSGDFAEERLSLWCPLTFDGKPVPPSSRNKFGRTLVSLNNGPIADGEIDVTQFVGRAYTVVVAKNDKGKTVIESITAPTSA